MVTVSLSWVLNFANAVVGVGLLTMPYCYEQCGVILTTLMIIFSGYITKLTCEYLLRAGSYTRKSSYEQLALAVYGNSGKLLCELSTIGVTLGTLVAFMVVIGDLAPAIVVNQLGFENSWTLRSVLMLGSCAFVLPLSMMRSVASLASFNAASMTFYVTFIFVVFCHSLSSISALEWWTTIYFWRPMQFFKCLPIILLSYNCQAQVFIFYSALPEPNMKTMMAIVEKAISLVNSFYITAGLFGYLAFYNPGVFGDVLENFPAGFLTDLMKLGFLFSVIISFPLMCFPVRSSINSLLFADKRQGILHDVITNGANYIAPDKFALITLGLVSSTLVIGILVPKVEVVLGITGAVAGTFICIMLPSALFFMAGAKDRRRRFAAVVFFVGTLSMLACTMTSVSDIVAGEPKPVPVRIAADKSPASVEEAPKQEISKDITTALPKAAIAKLHPKVESHEDTKHDVSKDKNELNNQVKVVKVVTKPVIEEPVRKPVGETLTKNVLPALPPTQPPVKHASTQKVTNSDVKDAHALNNALHGTNNNAVPAATRVLQPLVVQQTMPAKHVLQPPVVQQTIPAKAVSKLERDTLLPPAAGASQAVKVANSNVLKGGVVETPTQAPPVVSNNSQITAASQRKRNRDILESKA